MLWHNLSLRVRILVSYGCILALTSLLTLFILVRIASLNTTVNQLNAGVVQETTAAINLTKKLATAQQLVNRYLQQPQRDHFREVNRALDEVDAAIDTAHAEVVTTRQQQNLALFETEVISYRTAFQELTTGLAQQRNQLETIHVHIFQAGKLLNEAIGQYPRIQNPDAALLLALSEAQIGLQAADLQIDRLLIDQSTEDRILEQLDMVTQRLSQHTQQPDVGEEVQEVLDEVRSARSNILLLVGERAQAQQLGEYVINQQASTLKAEADTIAENALMRLNSATAGLEQQMVRTQQIAGGLLFSALVGSVVAGFFLARTITQPIQHLVSATRQINQGNFDVYIEGRDASEIGQLTASFNEMAAALKQEHAEVQRQQKELADRNQELEHAIHEVRESIAAREALAATVRILSVPVITVMHGVVVLPLVGEMDEQRMTTLMERLLHGIEQQHARMVILDLTGVPTVSQSLANGLLQSVQAAELLGSRCILVGIRPAIAEAIVCGGFELEGLTTRATLQDAISDAMREDVVHNGVRKG